MEPRRRSQRAVVYTAIFGGYDELREPRIREKHVEYLCFTDNPYLKSKVWTIRYHKPSDDPLMQARRLKILAHDVIDCDISLWIDGRNQLHRLNGVFDLTADLALTPHPTRGCIFDEADHCKRLKRGDPDRIDRAVARYKAEGHPRQHGLWYTGVVFRRHTRAAIDFNRHWWGEIAEGSSRDQISVPVVMRRTGVSYDNLPVNVPCYTIGRHRQWFRP